MTLHCKEFVTSLISSLGDIWIVKENSLIFLNCWNYCLTCCLWKIPQRPVKGWQFLVVIIWARLGDSKKFMCMVCLFFFWGVSVCVLFCFVFFWWFKDPGNVFLSSCFFCVLILHCTANVSDGILWMHACMHIPTLGGWSNGLTKMQCFASFSIDQSRLRSSCTLIYVTWGINMRS